MLQVSCEEDIDQIDKYCATNSPPVTTCEKEHILVCIRIKIGNRNGVLLLDSGYHIAKPITIMRDYLYPHSEEIIASTKGSLIKTYTYRFHTNPDFVLWHIVNKKDGNILSEYFSLIHVSRPFLSAIDIAERRNLVYTFKTLLHRNENGELIAGLYFPIKTIDEVKVTLFFVDDDNQRHEAKIPLSFFLQNKSDEVKLEYEQVLNDVESRSSHGRKLRKYLGSAGTLLKNEDFLNEFIKLNEEVDKISKDN